VAVEHDLDKVVPPKSVVQAIGPIRACEFSDAAGSDPSRPVPTAKDVARGGISANSGNTPWANRAASCTHGGQMMLSS
jgi:hypothetical protein